ncbi:MAG: hypothetical protein ACI915_000269 [Gammaproteobacteria bacterium]|jgi:hypothetical protein
MRTRDTNLATDLLPNQLLQLTLYSILIALPLHSGTVKGS